MTKFVLLPAFLLRVFLSFGATPEHFSAPARYAVDQHEDGQNQTSEYCSSRASQTGATISNVFFSNLNNYTGESCSDYADFTDMTAFVFPGGSYQLGVSAGTCSEFANVTVKAFIDWNGDGDFDDDLETVVTFVSTTGEFVAQSVTVPDNALIGIVTRMRIILQQTDTPQDVFSCGEYGVGETEDYLIEVVEDAFTVRRSISLSTLPEFSTTVDQPSEPSSFVISAINVDQPVLIVAPSPFEVSLDGETYVSQLEVWPTVEFKIMSRVFVRYAPTEEGTHGEVISILQNGFVDESVSVFGLTVQNVVSITGFDPASGPVGTEVVITGTGFWEATNVTFNGVEISAGEIISPTSIMAVVPEGATTGPVIVVTTQGTAVSSSDFIVTSDQQSLAIADFTPQVGEPGDEVVINGEGFSDVTAVNFGDLPSLSFTVNSTIQITAVVPAGATTGKVTVVTSTGSTTSQEDFVVIPPSTNGAPELYLYKNIQQPDGFIKTNNLSVTDALYVDNYLYVTYNATSKASLAIFNASDPLNPVFLKSLDYTDREFSKMLLEGDMLYIIGQGLSIYNVSVLSDPQALAFHLKTVDASNSSLSSGEIDKLGNLLFMDNGIAGLKAVDISNINSPVRTGVRNMSGSGYVGISFPSSSSLIAFDDYSAYFAAINTTTGALTSDGSLAVAGWPVDVLTNPSGIVFISSEGNSAGYIASVDPVSRVEINVLDISANMTYPGRITFASDDILLVKAQFGNSFLAIDISNPASIQFLKKYPGNSSNGGGCFRFFRDHGILLMNASGVLGIYSNVPALPAPEATNATNVTTTSFTANWSSVAEATSYKLDISADNFNTFVSGYNGASVPTTTKVVTGLTNNTEYKYRVRAVKSAGIESPNSNVIAVTTIPLNQPSITSFTPTSGAVGTQVSITGTNFTGTTSVTFNLVEADFTVVSPITITAIVPQGATTGKIKVTTGNGTVQSVGSFTVIVEAAPTISLLTPASGPVGTEVEITGTGFSEATGVAFNGEPTMFTVVSPTSITAIVPEGATTGLVNVITPQGTAMSPSNFVVTTDQQSLTITGFAPGVGEPGDEIVITGEDFNDVTAVNFGLIPSLSFTVTSALEITAVVPEGAITGKITVVTSTGSAVSQDDFIVAPPSTGAAPELSLYKNVQQPDGFIKTNNLWVTDALYIDDYLYVTYNGTGKSALAIFDATDPLNPVFLKSLDYTDREFSKMLLENDVLYIIGQGLSIYNVSVLSDPQVLAFHLKTVDGSNASLSSSEIDKLGNLLFMDNGVLGLKSVDISNLNAPVRTGARDMSGSGYVGISFPTASSLIAFDDYSAYFATINTTTGALTSNGSLAVAGWPVDVLTNSSGVVFISSEGNAAGYIAAVDPINRIELNVLDISANMTYPGKITFASDNVMLVKAQFGNSFLAIDISNPSSIQFLKKYPGNSSNSGGGFRFFREHGILLMSASGVLGIYSNVPPLPSPTAANATNVTTNSFTANWNSVAGAVSYELDISADNFDSFLTGYNGASVTATSKVITGLNLNTQYKYRVRAVKAAGIESGNSNVISVTTLQLTPPNIFSFAPTSGVAGASVTISGANFTGATSVTFNSVQADFTIVSPTTITAIVPENATFGKISVTSAQGTAQSVESFTVLVNAPVISTFSPSSGGEGTTVTITGANFLNATSVTFNMAEANYTVLSSSTITAVVPANATTGKVRVSTSAGVGESVGDFTFISEDAPTITTFIPATGPVGTAVTITGTNLSTITAVKFNETAAVFQITSPTTIMTSVPVGANTGKISLISSAGAVLSSSNFVVTVPNCNVPKPGITASTTSNAPFYLLTSSSDVGNQWLLNGVVLQGKTSKTLEISAEGSYTVRVTIGNCSNNSDPFVFIPTSAEGELNDGIEVFPIPVKTTLFITVPKRGEHVAPIVKLSSFDGRVLIVNLMEGAYDEWTAAVEMENFVAGMYVAMIETERKVFVRKILKL